MSILRDQIVVVDLEATCWEKRVPPPNERSEIIEIGVALVDAATFEISQPKSILVKPIASKVSPFCVELTTITQELVDTEGISFAEACAILEAEYDTPHRLWGSWGSFDKNIFQEQCTWMGVPYPFSKLHVNLKTLFATKDNERNRIGMTKALAKIDLKLEGTHHRGGDDAYNIARILQSMLQRHGIEVLKKHW